MAERTSSSAVVDAPPDRVLAVVADLDGSYAPGARDDGGTDVRHDLGLELRVPLPGLLGRRAGRTVTSTSLTELVRRAARG